MSAALTLQGSSEKGEFEKVSAIMVGKRMARKVAADSKAAVAAVTNLSGKSISMCTSWSGCDGFPVLHDHISDAYGVEHWSSLSGGCVCVCSTL